MTAFLVSADSGRFYASHEDIEQLFKNPEGVEWDLALFDKCPDPHYYKGQLKITKLNIENGTLEGTIVYNGKPRKFSGVATDRAWEEKIDYSFNFIEPAAELSQVEKQTIVHQSLMHLEADLAFFKNRQT